MHTNICLAAPRRVTNSAVIRDSYLLMRRPLRHRLPHLNDPAQPLMQVHRLVRGQPLLIQQFENVVDSWREDSCSEIR